MNKQKSNNYIFENDILSYESFINEFTFEIFKEFDLKADKLELESKIDDLINGEIVNETENQAAFHPKYRSHISNKEELPRNLKDAELKAEEFFNRCISSENGVKKQVNIITLGIGGSYEGPKILLECFNHPIGWDISGLNKINYDFITGSDPNEFEYKTRSLDAEDTFFIVSSKSFTTDETIELLKKAFFWSNSKSNFIAITANPNEAKKYGIEEIIEFDKEIGGRYSIWSPVTQFHLCGEKRSRFEMGGHQADIDLKGNKEYLKFVKNLSYSDIWLNNFKGKNARAILSYMWNLRSLPDYLQQLEMESLGKKANYQYDYNKTGQIIFGGYGPKAQHSYFQLLHQGTQDVCADIIANRGDSESLNYAQAITQSKLLSFERINLKNEEKINSNVPVNLFLLRKLDPYSLGYLIATWEHRTFITSVMLGINPFDQFGVNAGKIYTKKYLADKD
tara:strand:- start:231 stop:1586 length:1356 start_codon:yes stop_codon:yes gene_type:complete